MFFKKQTLFFICITGFIFFLVVLFLFYFFFAKDNKGLLNPLIDEKKEVEVVKPLDKYTFTSQQKRAGVASQITLDKVLKQDPDFTAYQFSYFSDGRKITGLLHLPNKEGKLPTVIMLRGYVEKTEYQTGVGTRPAGEVYAKNGFITIAPDFLGYGESDSFPEGLLSMWEERFARPVTVIDLLASVPSLPQADPEKTFLWGHSNGGMTALAVLEITGAQIPTTLWAPVSVFFPYDILFYINESEDKGKYLRKELAGFEKDYDVNNYSIDEYLSWIKAPVQIHQGGQDPYVLPAWSQVLVDKLEAQKLKVNYFVYPAADHQLRPDWDTVVQRDLGFFQSFL